VVELTELESKMVESLPGGKDDDDTTFSVKATRWKRLIRNDSGRVVRGVCGRELGSGSTDFISAGSQMLRVGSSSLSGDWSLTGG